MWRGIAGVIVGYIVMFVLVAVCFTIAWFILGAEGSYRGQTWDVSPTWIVMAIVVALIAAMAGGLVCRMIARNTIAVMVLALLVLVLGAAQSAAAFVKADDDESIDERPANVDMIEAMNNAEQPGFMLMLNPIIGVAGVLIGGMMRTGAKPPAPDEAPSSHRG